MVQNTSRARPGSFNGGRSTIAEYSQRSRGIMWLVIVLSSSALEMRRLVAEAERHDLVGAHHLGKRGADDAQRPFVEIRAVHRVDAVGHHDGRKVAAAGGSRGREYAGIGVDPGDQHG